MGTTENPRYFRVRRGAASNELEALEDARLHDGLIFSSKLPNPLEIKPDGAIDVVKKPTELPEGSIVVRGEHDFIHIETIKPHNLPSDELTDPQKVEAAKTYTAVEPTGTHTEVKPPEKEITPYQPGLGELSEDDVPKHIGFLLGNIHNAEASGNWLTFTTQAFIFKSQCPLWDVDTTSLSERTKANWAYGLRDARARLYANRPIIERTLKNLAMEGMWEQFTAHAAHMKEVGFDVAEVVGKNKTDIMNRLNDFHTSGQLDLFAAHTMQMSRLGFKVVDRVAFSFPQINELTRKYAAQDNWHDFIRLVHVVKELGSDISEVVQEYGPQMRKHFQDVLEGRDSRRENDDLFI